MKWVVIIDSFKGCLSSVEAEQAAAEGIRSVCPDAEIVCLPVADGGEGMLETMIGQTRGTRVEVDVHDPLMRPIRACYGVMGDGETAVVEMAQASGLPLLTVAERNPMLTTSYGTGELIKAAVDAGYRRIVLGIGGSATNDAGMGMMQALGARIFDVKGNELPVGNGSLLKKVAAFDLDAFRKNISGIQFLTACDVDNPFCGEHGAATVFAPQKGADGTMVRALEEGMVHFARQIFRNTGCCVENLPGAGAAGGIGGCLFAFFHSSLQPGIDLILEQMNFRRLAKDAHLVITGEGKADRQTLMGKVPVGVLRVSKELGVDVVLLAGAVEDADMLEEAGFKRVVPVSPKNLSLEEVMRPQRTMDNIKRVVATLIHTT